MAKFNEILKTKREELGLSIADISERTRLTERYIVALEKRDIPSFEEDLSYLRYFVRAYCDAVGVPYDMVREDVQKRSRHLQRKRRSLSRRRIRIWNSTFSRRKR
ncbi:MAG: helix-turn-helix domain-containing protein [Merdibacter sp.]